MRFSSYPESPFATEQGNMSSFDGSPNEAQIIHPLVPPFYQFPSETIAYEQYVLTNLHLFAKEHTPTIPVGTNIVPRTSPSTTYSVNELYPPMVRQQSLASTLSSPDSASIFSFATPLTEGTSIACTPISKMEVDSMEMYDPWVGQSPSTQSLNTVWNTNYFHPQNLSEFVGQQLSCVASQTEGLLQYLPGPGAEPYFDENSLRSEPFTMTQLPPSDAVIDMLGMAPASTHQTEEVYSVTVKHESQETLPRHGAASPPLDTTSTVEPGTNPRPRPPPRRNGPAACRICHRVFRRLHNLRNHMRDHEGAFECKVCRMRFAEQGNLTSHLKSHEGPFTCDVCDKVFMRRIGLTAHYRIHDFDRQKVQCQVEGCGKSYRRAGDLSRHIKSSHRDSFNPCMYCSKSFSRRDQQHRHENGNCSVRKHLARMEAEQNSAYPIADTVAATAAAVVPFPSQAQPAGLPTTPAPQQNQQRRPRRR